MRRLLFIVIIMAGIFACKKTAPPKYLIQQEDLVPVLVDLHLVYSIQSSMEYRKIARETDSVDTHGYIFNKHGIDRALFDSTISWYSQHPKQFTEVYDEVVMQLTRMSDSLSIDKE